MKGGDSMKAFSTVVGFNTEEGYKQGLVVLVMDNRTLWVQSADKVVWVIDLKHVIYKKEGFRL